MQQGRFLYVPDCLTAEVTAQLVAYARALVPLVHRNYLPGHKQGGSVSRYLIDECAPLITALYRSATFIDWLQGICGEPLQLAPADDPHAYALYYYNRPGDHIGWHYDTSYYLGRRYTVLLGVLDRSTCRLDCQLHTREPGMTVIDGSVQIPPGGLVVFDGDRLRHRISPLGDGGERVSLTLEYVTDARMHRGWRLISNFKDALAYFGLRQVFGKRRGLPAPEAAAESAAPTIAEPGAATLAGPAAATSIAPSRGAPASS
ncbi:MAG: hypothetical protein JOZ93_00730 [Sinobacteraceae bacterium]|nr:hypothetical protein [Nevskiaceae bacterium]